MFQKKDSNYSILLPISTSIAFYVLIPDCRFKNEIEAFKQDGWPNVSVRIIRDNFISNLTEKQLNHPSETALDDYEFDYYIFNSGDMDYLNKEVEYLVECLEV